MALVTPNDTFREDASIPHLSVQEGCFWEVPGFGLFVLSRNKGRDLCGDLGTRV